MVNRSEVVSDGKMEQEILRMLYNKNGKLLFSVLGSLRGVEGEEGAAEFEFQMLGNMFAVSPKAVLEFFFELTKASACYFEAYSKAIKDKDWEIQMKLDMVDMERDTLTPAKSRESAELFTRLFTKHLEIARANYDKKGGLKL